MRNLILLCVIGLVVLVGCTPTQVVKTVSISKSVFCANTTAEARAKIRAKQKLETNVCGDDIE